MIEQALCLVLCMCRFFVLKKSIFMNVGDKLPEILGVDQNGNEIKTSDFAGRKLVLYTYPKDNTSGCTAEACSLRDNKEAWPPRDMRCWA